MTTRPLLGVLKQHSEKFNSQEVFPEFHAFFSSNFPACFKIVHCYLQDSLGIGLFTESQEKDHFTTLLILELGWIFIYMLYHLSTTCKSKYCTCIYWKRPVSARFRVPRRPVPVWNLPSWVFCAKLPSDCHILCFQFSKPVYSSSQLQI